MAKQKQTSKRASQSTVRKTPAKRATAKAAASRVAASRVAASKAATPKAAKRPVRKPTKANVAAVKSSGSRRRQAVAVSHYREEDYVGGLRSFAKTRDLGVAAASGGLAQALVIRLIGPCDPKVVSRLYSHDAQFQLLYVLNGWVKTYLEGEGEMTMRQGSCWTQPPRSRHLIRDYSDNCELLQVTVPGQFKTLEVKS